MSEKISIQDSENSLRDRFVKADNEKVINLTFVRWIKKVDECFYMCSRMDGCRDQDTHKVCKTNNSISHDKLAKLFQEERN
jgi:hypothetical protein